MPLAFRPDKTVPVSLDVDADIDPPQRPAFLCRFLTEGDAQRIEDCLHEGQAAADDADAAMILCRALCLSVTGWRNMIDATGKPLTFAGPESLGVLTYRELLELRGKVLCLSSVDRDIKKKRGSSPSTLTGNSAPTVEGAASA
jgi:hypothetical protein